MSECNHDCSSCSENCGERKEANVFEKKPLHEGCRVGKVFGVVSGKGGVGKSMVTSQLAVAMRREGYNVAILDADIPVPLSPRPSASMTAPVLPPTPSCPATAAPASS